MKTNWTEQKMPLNSKIAVFSPNPVLDVVLIYNKYNPKDRKKYADRTIFSPGGMGFNMTRTILKLGGQAEVFTLLGSPIGSIIKKLAVNEGIVLRYVQTRKSSRIAIIPVLPKQYKETMLVSPSPRISIKEIRRLQEMFLGSIESYKMLAIGGSLPLGVNRSFYNQLIKESKKVAMLAFVDTGGEALIAALEAKPWAIKIGEREASFLLSKKKIEPKEAGRLCMKLERKGISISIVTRGEKGAIVCFDNRVFELTPPKVVTVSTVGSGDSFNGGFLYGAMVSQDIVDAIKLGVACGVVNTQSPIPSDVNIANVKRLIKEIKVEEIGG